MAQSKHPFYENSLILLCLTPPGAMRDPALKFWCGVGSARVAVGSARVVVGSARMAVGAVCLGCWGRGPGSTDVTQEQLPPVGHFEALCPVLG